MYELIGKEKNSPRLVVPGYVGTGFAIKLS